MPLTFHHHQLSNGLDVVVEANPDAHSMAVGMFVQTGARDEEVDINGVSHFLEHMMFKGSERYSAEDINRIFDEMGARYNAFTSQEMTAYYANVLPEFTEKAVEHLAELFRPAIRPNDFQMEKGVILEEIAMHMDEPGQRLYDKVMSEHFEGHPLRLSVLGPPASIKSLSREQMEQYFRARYGPGNMVVAATGRVDFPELVKLIEKYCGGWSAVRASRQKLVPSHQPKRLSLVDAKLNRQYTMAMCPGPSAQDERRFAAAILSDLIGDPDGGRFYWALVDNAIAEDADFGFYPHDGCGSYYLYLVTDPERTADAVKIAQAEMARIKHDLKEDEIQRAKNKIASSIVLQGEVPLGRLRTIGGEWIYNRTYRSLEQDMATFAAVSSQSLRQLMAEFAFEPMTLVTLGPEAQA